MTEFTTPNKFTLEIELEQSGFCNECPLINESTDYCVYLNRTIDGFMSIPRPSDCPLKPLPPAKPIIDQYCDECKHSDIASNPHCFDCDSYEIVRRDKWESRNG